ncbi:phosphofructokinase [Brachybacterium endophyticum]|uniref:Phosphofructokinase n=1 Tax=Brachybacterium endophyticum TaxID=2182385 RepID=A0A2U2RGU7_9MICO|nr:1-phosphofructokinase family hexose kinase [Brachybacterium endophyticum]PWH05092.1 phosphofructokinase [Brachybacterium endophyticum]
MIRTVTANPSLDRSVELAAPLVAGGVHRIVADSTQVGGKGVNVARALALAGVETEALVPVGPEDQYLRLLVGTGIRHRAVPVAGAVRTNLTVLSPTASGTSVTTKLNEPGSAITAAELRSVEQELLEATTSGGTVMLSGSLAPGFPVDWYAGIVRALHERNAWVGVDTSDVPLTALGAAWREDRSAAPDLLTPNALELAQLTGQDAGTLDALEAAPGDLGPAELAPVARATQDLRAQGVAEVLVTLGGAGAVLADARGTWYCEADTPSVVSTVGAGDCAAAGYLLARSLGEDGPQALARAVAYGSAAVALPGTTIPRPDQVHVRPGAVRSL